MAGISRDAAGREVYGENTLSLNEASASYPLATNATLASGANTAPVTVTSSASYGWAYIFGGTTPSLALQALGPDGTTWQTIATVSASGAQGIVIFAGAAGAQIRLLNTGANSITGLSSTLSS